MAFPAAGFVPVFTVTTILCIQVCVWKLLCWGPFTLEFQVLLSQVRDGEATVDFRGQLHVGCERGQASSSRGVQSGPACGVWQGGLCPACFHPILPMGQSLPLGWVCSFSSP